MKRSITVIFLVSLACSLKAQVSTRAEIRNVDFSMMKDSLVITYDIVNAAKDESFLISVGIFGSDNKKISASSFTGDVNKLVSGGKNKRAVWHMSKDGIFIEKEIYVEIQAVPRRQVNIQNSPATPSVSPFTCLLYSTVFPGAGNAKATGKPYWYAIGIAGYSFAALSVISNHKAFDNYENYKNSYVKEERNDFFTKAQSQDDRSKLYAGVAAGIWVSDLVFTFFQAKAKNKNGSTSSLSGWKLSPGIAFGDKPVLSFQYQF